jgi:hypothetical protein
MVVPRRHRYACDFQPQTTLTPFGILLPETGKNHVCSTESKVTADFMVDRLEEMVPQWRRLERKTELESRFIKIVPQPQLG